MGDKDIHGFNIQPIRLVLADMYQFFGWPIHRTGAIHVSHLSWLMQLFVLPIPLLHIIHFC